MSKKATKPEPVSVTTVCSECGLNWDLHGDDPTTDDCIRILKAELANARFKEAKVIPMPYPVYPPRAPWAEPYRLPYRHPSTFTWGEPNETTKNLPAFEFKTPQFTSGSVSVARYDSISD
jgi:hypothetical protein